MLQQQKFKLDGVQHVIAVASGKGGVGKSTVAANLALSLAALGSRVGLVDADVYGPSVPIMFDTVNEQPDVQLKEGKQVIMPVLKYGIKLMSIGFFVSPEQALIWRGPMATNALNQLFQDADWGELDYLVIDMPPGTGDVHITITQKIDLAGVVIVSTPQQVALADARKAINMFQSSGVEAKVLGLVENMAWFTPAELPDSKYYLFGKEGCKQLAEQMQVPLLGQIPIVQRICESGDKGSPAVLNDEPLVKEAFLEMARNVTEVITVKQQS